MSCGCAFMSYEWAVENHIKNSPMNLDKHSTMEIGCSHFFVVKWSEFFLIILIHRKIVYFLKNLPWIYWIDEIKWLHFSRAYKTILGIFFKFLLESAFWYQSQSKGEKTQFNSKSWRTKRFVSFLKFEFYIVEFACAK